MYAFLVRLARIRTSSWAPLVVRTLLASVGLVVLGVVGATLGTGPKHFAIAGVPAPSLPLPSLEGLPLTAAITAADDRSRVAPAADAGPDGATPPPAEPVALAPPPTTTPPSRASPEAPVRLNEADATELRRLPGVGAKRADAILALRARLGRFHRVEELLQVKGVGRGTLKKWRPLVRIDPSPPPPSVTPPRP